VDGAGHAYVTGETSSTAATFPETSGAFQAAKSDFLDAFVAKVNPSGSALVYASYLGGTGFDVGNGVAVDGAGNAYVVGQTDSKAATFPITPGAFQPANAGGLDAFVAKVNPSGSALAYSSFLGGSGEFDRGNAVALDGAGNAYVAGETDSPAATFPDTPGAFQPTNDGGIEDAFVAKVNPSGSALAYASFLGGSGDDRAFGIAVDGAGNAYVAGKATSTAATFPETSGAFQAASGGGDDAFVAKVNPSGSALVYAGFLGGGGADFAQGIAVDAAGNAYVTGQTASTAATFPDTPGNFQADNAGGADAFVAEVNATGSALVYATFLGGSSFDSGFAIAVDLAGSAYVAGVASSTAATFPDTPGVFQPANAGGMADAFVAKVGGAFPAGPCTQTLTGDVTGPFTVDAGQTLCVANARVIGPITVNAGGGLSVVGSQVSNGIVANSPASFSVCGSQVSGPSSIPGRGVVVTNSSVPVRIGDPSTGCAPNRVAGDVILTANSGGLVLGSTTVTRNVTVNDNSGATVVKANTVGNTLACSGNAPAPTNAGQANTAAAKSGQCAAL